jgi:peptidoglycan/xylan/chitin deacetylase (PgdA/CDA1 family)
MEQLISSSIEEVRMANETTSHCFWPDGIRPVISISMQFEAGGQPPRGTDSPFPKVDFPESVPSDAAANTWFAYGYREGVPRMLDLWDRHNVKVTSHMIGEAVQRHPSRAATRRPATARAGAPSTR